MCRPSPIPPALGGEKGIEYLVLDLGVDALAVVAINDGNGLAVVGDLKAQLTLVVPFVGVDQRVHHQVGNDLREVARIAVDDHARLALDLNCVAGRPQLRANAEEDFVEFGADIELLADFGRAVDGGTQR